ncbi:MAG: TlpA disulfide reductase family protein [Neisseria sp.]|nr:TlpA disulfide reductase family protein [Neisseria sp.]
MKYLAVLSALLPAFAFSSGLEHFPGGQPRDLTQFDAPLRIVNVWATWCAPCRREMPELSDWYRKQPKNSVDLIGIAIDRAENINRFLQNTPVSYPIWRYTGKNSRNLMRNVGNTSGGIPYTLIERKSCTFKYSITGEVNTAKLNAAVREVRKQCG